MGDTLATIYLDHHATTPCDPRVVEAMLPYFDVWFANPASQSHRAGRQSAQAVAEAREHVAALLGAMPGEIIFTGSATESNNLAILGIANGLKSDRRTIVTTAIEHKSVLEPTAWLGTRGFDVRVLPVDQRGRVDVSELQSHLSDQTLLVSIQAANNEVGTIQDIAAIVDVAHEHGALVHCDAVQAVGRIPVDVNAWDVDLLSLSAHKLYGPKGIAALYVRGGKRALPLQPLMFGGGQEDGLRPGTLNVPGIVGFGEASRLSQLELLPEADRVGRLRDRFEAELIARLPSVRVNGALDARLPGNSSLTFPGIDAEALIANVPELELSVGSACNSGALEPSYVLTALGMSREEAYQTLRVGLGRFTQDEDLRIASKAICKAIERISLLSNSAVV
jgi:cysteine desulfurase